MTKARKELSELHATHWITERELERAKDINDKSILENLALNRSISDWKRSCGSLQTQLEAKTKELATLSAATEAKDKELENFREGQYYDEFSDSTHRTRQDRYKTENNALCSDIEALRKQGLKMQEDFDMTTRNRNELECEIQGLCTTLRKNSTIMETQRVDLGTYKTSLGRLENKYNDVRRGE